MNIEETLMIVDVGLRKSQKKLKKVVEGLRMIQEGLSKKEEDDLRKNRGELKKKLKIVSIFSTVGGKLKRKTTIR